MSGVGRVGVVVAARDAERWLGEALESLRRQDLRDWTCVVVDDGSSDATAEVATAVGDARVAVLRQAGSGVSAARNAGIAALPGVELLAFLDADDACLPTALTTLTVALDGRPDAVGAFGLAEYVDAAGRPVDPGRHPARQLDRRTWRGARLRPLPPDADSTFADLVEYGPAWPACVGLYRAAAVRTVGGFDPALRTREDWDLQLRLSRLGPLVPVPAQVAWYRRHDANLTRGILADAVDRERVRAKACGARENTLVERSVLRRSAVRGHLAAARHAGRTAVRCLRADDLRGGLRAAAATATHLVRAGTVRHPRPDELLVRWGYGLPPGAADRPWEP